MRIEALLEQLTNDPEVTTKAGELYINGSITIEQLTNLKVQGKITDVEFMKIIYGSCCYSENM